jgi:anti-anti-sigma regulatory factor
LQKTVKIEKQSDGRTAIIWLIGRIQSEDLGELRTQMSAGSESVVLDLGDVTLVDADVVRFLGCSEQAGLKLVRCPPYVREWIRRECAET